MGKNFHETLNEQLKDPEFRAEWEALESERQIIRSIIEKDKLENVTIKQLFAEFHGEYTKEEVDWGEPIGEEIW